LKALVILQLAVICLLATVYLLATISFCNCGNDFFPVVVVGIIVEWAGTFLKPESL
jgi:hypothetical protein